MIMIMIVVFGFYWLARRKPDDPDVGVGGLNLNA